ncbi:MAG TPA: hypothetical protein VM578_07565 [Candidatus Saccharimonadales bacterium]|nr:hypothetical protein [Candidatus Saccharimonadales bacterium]
MNSETNMTQASGSSVKNLLPHLAVIDSAGVKAIRYNLHELANVFTGVTIAGELLLQHMEAGPLHQYASNICEGSERGCVLVREICRQLLAACGEIESSRDDLGTPQR